MRRVVFIAALLIAATSASVQAAGKMPEPSLTVPLYECEHINPSQVHFTCTFKQGDFYLVWQTDVKKLPTEERRLAWYTYSKLALHIVEYGNTYHVTAINGARSDTCMRAKTLYTQITCYDSKDVN